MRSLWTPAAAVAAVLAVVVAVVVTTAVVVVPRGVDAPDAARSDRGGCERRLAPGTSSVPVRLGGTDYPVRVHVPAGLPRQRRVPLVVDLHPSGGNAEQQAARTRFRDLAEREGFVVANPDGVIPAADPNPDRVWYWNVPGVPTLGGEYPPPGSRDDVAFLGRVVDRVQRLGCTDASRVYMTGFSGGARMSSAFACARPGIVAAIAPVAGLRAGRPAPDDPSVPEVQDCAPRVPVPVVTFHGDADETNPYEGNGDLRWGYTVPVATQTWARLDGCRSGPVASPVTPGVRAVDYRRCRGRVDVRLYVVAGGTHSWPGSDADPTSTKAVDATRLAWEFFEQHRR